MQQADVILKDGCVLCMDPEGSFFYPGSIAVQDRKIAAIGSSTAVGSEWTARKSIDASRHVIMPGLINTHGHASNSLIRGLGGDLPLQTWLTRICWPMMSSADEQDLFAAVQLSFLELLCNGVTTVADMWQGVDVSARAADELGIRALLAPNIKDYGDPKRGQEELAKNIELHDRWNGHGSGRILIGMGPHSVYTCSSETLEACAQLSEARNLHIQVHASETEREVVECRAHHSGRTPIQVLFERGLITQRTLLAHAVWVQDDEADIIADRGAAVSHNISSNLKLGSGIAPIKMYFEKGICVSLGTDGPGSNDGLDLLRDLRTAIFTQRGIHQDASLLGSRHALEMVTIRGAQALSMEEVTGSLEIGKRADLIMIDLDGPYLTPNHCDDADAIQSLIVFCATGRDVSHVFVDGELIVDRGIPTKIDARDVQERAQKAARKLITQSES